MKKLSRKAPLHSLTTELAKVKGGGDPETPGLIEEPPPTTDARSHIIDLG